MESLLLKENTFKIIGACFEVHKNLGCGFLEAVYAEALAIEFTARNIPFEWEKILKIYYKEAVLEKTYVADYLCFSNVILELKAFTALTSQHESQVINNLKATGLQVGLLINFGEPSLK